MQVAALEVQNVKKAISRYGTLPKGARIGAYLESLRQSGISNEQQEQVQTVNPVLAEQAEPTPRSLSPRTNIRTQPQMIRSNSSSGVTTFFSPSSPTASKLGRNRNFGRNNSNEHSGGLKTFRVAQNPNSFRGGSPSRSAQPSLATLEFPPPPTDLPPPPEEFDCPQEVESFSSATVVDLKRKVTIVSPLSIRKQVVDDDECGEVNDVSNLEPSVEEASSRFGISLKKREPSVESCCSVKDGDKEKSPIRTSPSQEERSTNIPAVLSPLEKEGCEMGESAEQTDDNNLSKVFKRSQVMKEMELKLVAEIKERADQKSKNIPESPQEPVLPTSSINQDPVAQLVTELSQSLNFDPVKKKTETTKKKDDFPQIIDFKSRLRKVENVQEKRDDEGEMNRSTESDVESTKRESLGSCDSTNAKAEEIDDKRKSTGSISSLKKFWEPKDSETTGSVQLSPKLATKNPKTDDGESTESDKTSKRVWPPSIEEKPLIPIKPPVKSAKPPVTTRPAVSAIYATPIAPKPPISAKPTTLDPKLPDDASKTDQLKGGKESILEISQALESTVNGIRSNPGVSSATWLQLSDKIGLLHGSCMDYADNVAPAHAKFHFRELLTRLEAQARQLRSAGTRNSAENVRYLNEVNNTIKDVVNVVCR